MIGISVVIPMYNAENTILETLNGLQEQRGNSFEVVVVDDGSRDSSPELVEGFSHQSPFPVRLIRQGNSGPARARNVGVEHSTGRVIIFLDSDCVPPRGWLEAMTAPLQGNTVGCNCGYQVRNGHSPVARYIDYEIAWRHQRLLGKNVDTLGSYSASILKEVFQSVGGFNTGYTEANAEDFDLAFKISRTGGKLLFSPDTFVYHYHPSSLRRYLRQQYRRGYWRVKMYLENRARILRGDSYTGHEAQAQFLLCHLALLSLPLTLVSPYSPAIGFGLLWLSNLPLGIWSFRREKKFLGLAPLLASARSLAGTFGVYAYLLQRIAPHRKREARP